MAVTTETKAKWRNIPEIVEAIISARTVSRKFTETRGQSSRKVALTRPMRFREFSTEIGLDNAQAYRYIRGGVTPDLAAQKKIAAWCKKHAAVLEK